MSKSRLVVGASLVLAAVLGSGVAQAHDADVQWSVTIGSPAPRYVVPAVIVQPRPVYLPAPVYVRPRPVVVQPPVYVQPRPVFVQYRQPTRWDRDGDGIPNARDHRYNPAWDRDGDGVPNRRDRHERNPHRG